MNMLQLALSELERLICCLLAEDRQTQIDVAEQLYRILGEKTAFEFAQINNVEAIVGHALIDIFDPDNVDECWRHAHEQNYRRISGYMVELDRISLRLLAANIPLVALKNGGIARGIHSCPGCCPMGDLDVLVERRHFQEAHRILVSEGYQFKFRSVLEKEELEAAASGGGAEYQTTLNNGETLWFELQWRPIAGRWIRPDQEPSAEELMARSIPVKGTAVRILCPEDNLIQVALHTAKHSYVRAPGIRLHLDVNRIVRSQSINWDEFLQRVQNLKVKVPVYFSLAIPHAIFNTPIPQEVLRTLRPPAWKENLIFRWIQKAGLFSPEDRKFSSIGYLIFTPLLYDDLPGMWRAVFPDRKWMKGRYSCNNDLLLPYYYFSRLTDLMLRRTL